MPFGVTVVVIIAESHLSIHTWPEHNYAAVDIFTCGTSVMPDSAINYILSKDGLNAGEMSQAEIWRGIDIQWQITCDRGGIKNLLRYTSKD
jgi:S-adenosylmethionine decarboxylase